MDIYDHLFRQGFELFTEAMTEAAQHAGSYFEDMQLSMQAYMKFALDHPELYQLCFERHVPGLVPSEESMRVAIQARALAAERIALLSQGGDVDPQMSFENSFNLVFALMHGLTALHLANEPHLPLGQGMYGSLISDAVSVFERAWKKD